MLRPLPSGAEQEPAARCPLGECDGSGWLLDEEGKSARPCACRERKIGQAATAQLGRISAVRLLEVSFDRKPICDLEPSLLRHVRSFIGQLEANLDAGRGLWFHGSPGTGKTALATLVLKTALDADRSAAFFSVPRLMAEIRRTYNQDSDESYLGLLEKLRVVDLLVLDDLGGEQHSEWVLEQLYSIVNERWQDKSSILVTTRAWDPHRDLTLQTLRDEIRKLKETRGRGALGNELEDVVGRLERTTERLGELDFLRDDPVTQLRRQIGSPTVSRLVEICDDPIPIMGPDLRLTASGA